MEIEETRKITNILRVYHQEGGNGKWRYLYHDLEKRWSFYHDLYGHSGQVLRVKTKDGEEILLHIPADGSVTFDPEVGQALFRQPERIEVVIQPRQWNGEILKFVSSIRLTEDIPTSSEQLEK